MINTISANDLKVRGISAIKKAIEKSREAIITVRGKDKYVVLPVEDYNRLREYELEAALSETKKEIKEGKFTKESVDKHLKRISSV